jgi:hypothetical protein
MTILGCIFFYFFFIFFLFYDGIPLCIRLEVDKRDTPLYVYYMHETDD